MRLVLMSMILLRRLNLLLSHLKENPQKPSKSFESEDESPDGDFDEDPAVVEKIAMLSNKLQYLAKKNKKFLRRRNCYKGSKKEDQKGCFNYKKLGHFIADFLDLQKDKSKEKS